MTKQERIKAYTNYMKKIHLLDQSGQLDKLFRTANLEEGLFELDILSFVQLENSPSELHIPPFATSIYISSIVYMDRVFGSKEPSDSVHHIFIPSSIQITPNLQELLHKCFINLESIQVEQSN